MSTNYITRSNQTTRSANVLSVGESLSHCRAADAGLTGAARVYLDQSAPSIFSFVRNLRDKSSPTGIVNRLGKHAACHAFEVQIFDNNRSEILYQPERETMLELLPLIPDSSVNLLEQYNCFAAAIRAFLAPCNLALGASKARFSLSIPSWIRYRWTIRERSEVFQPQVNSNRGVERGQWLGFACNREADVPFAAFAFDRHRLNLARNRAMQLDCNFSNTLNAKNISGEFDAIAVTRKSDAIETASRFESRIARFITALHSAKESLESPVHAPKNILAAAKVCQTQVTRCADFFQLIRLRVVVDRNSLFPRIATFLQRCMVQAAGFSQLSVESIRLGARCA